MISMSASSTRTQWMRSGPRSSAPRCSSSAIGERARGPTGIPRRRQRSAKSPVPLATISYSGSLSAMHIAESEPEYDIVASGTGDFADRWRRRGIPVGPRARSPIALLEQRCALARGPLLIHCVRVDDADIEIMPRRRCAVAHCPASNAKFGHGIAPLLRLLAAGIRVGMGSDSVASNNRMDILDESRLAALIHRAATRKHDAFGAHQALEQATIGVACASGLESRAGSLEVGNGADLAANRIDIPHKTPIGDS